MINVIRIIFLCFIVFGCSTISKGTREMTPREEYYLGRSVAANIITKYKLIKNNRVNKYLNKVGTILALSSDRPITYRGYRFAIIESDRKIAVSAPGGIILLSTSLLKKIDNEDELAGIIAHEISHIVLKHAQKTIKKSTWVEVSVNASLAVVSFFTKDKNLKKAVEHYDELVGDYAERVVNGHYNKKQEYEADMMAINILKKTGYSKKGLISFLQKQRNSSDGWTSNHPSDGKRIMAISKDNYSKISEVRTARFIDIKNMINLVTK